MQKWQNNGAGKIQAKRFNAAWTKLNAEHTTADRIFGVHGGEEMRSTVWSPFSKETREDVAAAQERIGQAYNWTVSKENAVKLVADIEAAITELEKTRPVMDERRTADEAAKSRAEADDRRQAIEAKSKAMDDEADKLKAKHRELIPIGRGVDALTTAAKNIRTQLAQSFPGIKFSVKTDRFSGGDSININWTDGPSWEQVDKIGREYVSGTFDAMTDCSGWRESAWTRAFGDAKYVHACREISKELWETVGREMCRMQHKDYQGEMTANLMGEQDTTLLREHAYLYLSHVELKAGQTIERLEDWPDEEMNTHGELWLKPVLSEVQSPLPADRGGQDVPISWQLNDEKQGIEIRFQAKPSESVREQLKNHGFRWSRFSSVWWAKDAPDKRQFAEGLCGA